MATSSYPTWTNLTGFATAPAGTAYVSVEAVGFDVSDPLIGVYVDDVTVTPSTAQLVINDGSIVLTNGGVTRFTLDSGAADFEQLTFPSGNGSEIKPSQMGGGVINSGTTLATTLTSPTDDPSGSPNWTVLTLEKVIAGSSVGTFTADQLQLGAQIAAQNGADFGFIADNGSYNTALFRDVFDADTPLFSLISPPGIGGTGAQARINLTSDTTTVFSGITLDAEATEVTGDLQVDGRLTGISNLSATSSAGLTLTTSYQDVPGASLTFTTSTANTVALVMISADSSFGGGITTAENACSTINVDGTDITTSGGAIVACPGNTFNGAGMSASYHWVVTLGSSGSHTIKMRSKKTSGASGSSALNVAGARSAGTGGCKISAIIFGG